MAECVDEELFRQFCDEKFPLHSTSKTIRREKGLKIIRHLNGVEKGSNSFGFWVKTRQFEIRSWPSLGLHNVLCQPCRPSQPHVVARRHHKHKKASKSSKSASVTRASTALAGQWRRVAFVEDFYSILLDAHTKTLNHGGYKPLLQEVSRSYSCLPRGAVQTFVNMCTICQTPGKVKRASQAPVKVKPTDTRAFNGRCQIEVVDMTAQPDGQYSWIGHYIDHWSKYHILFPLAGKSAADVAYALEVFVFPYIGPPRVLQSDSGRDFVKEIIRESSQRWRGALTSQIISGKPSHSHAPWNAIVKKMIRRKARDERTVDAVPWTHWLGQIMFNLNCQVQSSTGRTPYEQVYGQQPFGPIVPGYHGDKVLEEEDVEDMIDVPPQNPSQTAEESPSCIQSDGCYPPQPQPSDGHQTPQTAGGLPPQPFTDWSHPSQCPPQTAGQPQIQTLSDPSDPMNISLEVTVQPENN